MTGTASLQLLLGEILNELKRSADAQAAIAEELSKRNEIWGSRWDEEDSHPTFSDRSLRNTRNEKRK